MIRIIVNTSMEGDDMVNPIARTIAQRRSQHLNAQHAYNPQGYGEGTMQVGPWHGQPTPYAPPQIHPPNNMPNVIAPPPQRPSELAPPPAHIAPNWINRVTSQRQSIDLNGIQDLQAGATGNRLALARIYDFINSPAARKLTPDQWNIINAKARELRNRIRANQHVPTPDAFMG